MPGHIVFTSHTAKLQRPLLPKNNLAQQLLAHEQEHIPPTCLHQNCNILTLDCTHIAPVTP